MLSAGCWSECHECVANQEEKHGKTMSKMSKLPCREGSGPLGWKGRQHHADIAAWLLASRMHQFLSYTKKNRGLLRRTTYKFT